jgi:iron complex outermembrane receptor protein
LGVQITNTLKWDGNLTLSQNKIKNYTEYVLVDDGEAPQQADYYGTTNIAYSPDVIANSLFTYRYKSFNAGFQSSYAGKQYLDNTGNDDRSIDSYFVSNLRLAYNFRLKGIKELSVNLLINNFFNAEYETNGWVWAAYYHNAKGGLDPYVEKSYFPQAGTNIMTNLILKF